MSLPRFAKPLLIAFVALQWIGAGVFVRRWYRTWGTTSAERRESLPGDTEVDRPNNDQTHAVTIDATAEDVWPWIVQLGTGRAGWYSYDAIEDAMGLAVHSSDRIQPELQDLKEGDRIPLGPGVAFPVTWLERDRLMLLAGHDPFIGDASWLFLLRRQSDGRTRLITRFRVRWGATGPQRVLLAIIEPGSFVMERKMLLGIKARAERLARERVPVPA